MILPLLPALLFFATPQVPTGTSAPAATTAPAKPGAPVSTKHTITVHGELIHYTATCGTVPIINEGSGEVEANMFYIAYTKDGANPASRPVLFAFNGGPGSSSVWLHMGTLGPRRVAMNDDGSLPAPPFKVVDNQETWLASSDVVMLDAIGTGFSRTVSSTNRHFYGIEGDLEGFTSGIKGFLSAEHRWKSPIFVAGESYGGMRVAGLSNSLLQAGIAANGIISISGTMNYSTLDASKDNDVPYLTYLPSMTAVAWYHKKLSPRLMASLSDTLAEVEKFTDGEYAVALENGNTMTAKKRAEVISRLSEYTSLKPSFISGCNLRIRPGSFMAELLRDKAESVGRYDGRLIGKLSDGNASRPDYDASDAAVTPPFTAAFNTYLDDELKYVSTTPYRITGYNFIGAWNDDVGRGSRGDTSDMLRQAMTENPHLKVLLCCGWYDLACPYFAMRYTMSHLGEPADLSKNIHFEYFPAGHMMYIEKNSREKLQKDVSAFIASATPRP